MNGARRPRSPPTTWPAIRPPCARATSTDANPRSARRTHARMRSGWARTSNTPWAGTTAIRSAPKNKTAIDLSLSQHRPPERAARCDHEEQHGEREHHVRARGEERDAARARLLLVARRHETQHLSLVRPDERPDIEEHDEPEPGTDADGN